MVKFILLKHKDSDRISYNVHKDTDHGQITSGVSEWDYKKAQKIYVGTDFIMATAHLANASEKIEKGETIEMLVRAS